MAEKCTIGQLNMRFARDGWRSAGLEKQCPRCGEDRLVTATTIHGKTDYYCDVCAKAWIPADEEIA
jgi:uncharacterized protein (DUF983 family)